MSLAEIRCKYSDYFQQRKGKQNIFFKIFGIFSLLQVFLSASSMSCANARRDNRREHTTEIHIRKYIFGNTYSEIHIRGFRSYIK